MAIKFPIELDGDLELYLVVDGVDEVIAAHHNAIKDAIKAIEEKLGIDDSQDENSIDYILKNQAVKSDPPSGKYKVFNLYVDPDSGKLVVEFDDTPT